VRASSTLHPNLALLRNCERNNQRSSAMNHESNCVLLTPAHVASSRLPMFWIACAELFGYDHGLQWIVGHYLFAKKQSAQAHSVNRRKTNATALNATGVGARVIT